MTQCINASSQWVRRFFEGGKQNGMNKFLLRDFLQNAGFEIQDEYYIRTGTIRFRNWRLIWYSLVSGISLFCV